MSKLIPIVWDDKEQWNSPPSRFGSPYGYPRDMKFNIFDVGNKGENMEEGAKIYKLNHNSERANREWEWLDNLCSKIYTKYCRLWEIF